CRLRGRAPHLAVAWCHVANNRTQRRGRTRAPLDGQYARDVRPSAISQFKLQSMLFETARERLLLERGDRGQHVRLFAERFPAAVHGELPIGLPAAQEQDHALRLAEARLVERRGVARQDRRRYALVAVLLDVLAD